jgi:hypothetical protein
MFLRTYARWIDGGRNEVEMGKLEEDDFTRAVMFMADARLVRDHADCRLYQGMARDPAGLPRIPQTWLCTPSPDRTREILAQMAEREWE